MTAATSYRRIVSGQARGLVPSLARGAFSVVARPYGWAASLAEIAKSGQEAVECGLPVVSVGNITVGGTGKTTFTSFVVGELKKRGKRPLVISRGYLAGDDGMNDEAKLLARLHPDVLHAQGKDRVALARHAADAMLGDVIVLDDGFQYQRLARDLNCCLLDATNPFGYGEVLPRGLLREPLAGLYRARPIVITRTELAAPATVEAIRTQALAHHPYAKFVVTQMRPTALADVRGAATTPLESLRERPLYLASGVGNPESFARNVRALGGRVREHAEMSDHHAWTDAEVASLAGRAADLHVDMVVTTAKDAVKLAAFPWPEGAPPLRSLEIEVAITQGADTWKALLDEAIA